MKKRKSIPLKILLRISCLILIAGTLSSCFPAPHGPYYKPSYPDKSATLRRSSCGGWVGPLSGLEIPAPGNATLTMSTRDYKGQLRLIINLSAPAHHQLFQFTSNTFRLLDVEEGKEWAVKAKMLDFDRLSGQIPYTRVVDFSERVPAASEYILNDMEVWIPFSIDDFSPDTIRLHLPRITVGSKEYRIPSILLEADKEGKRIEGYKKSWDWWPYESEREKIKVDRFTIRIGATGGFPGWSKVDKRLRTSKMKGNIMISFPADIKWRFATNEIRFEDADFGHVRQLHFTHLRIESYMKVAFTAPFCCSRNARAELPITIDEARPEKLRVEIPPLLINGKEFVFEPVLLNRRRFDFGIYPFNC